MQSLQTVPVAPADGGGNQDHCWPGWAAKMGSWEVQLIEAIWDSGADRERSEGSDAASGQNAGVVIIEHDLETFLTSLGTQIADCAPHVV